MNETKKLAKALRAAIAAVALVDDSGCIFRALERSVAGMQLGHATYELLRLEVLGLMVPLTGPAARRAALSELISRLRDRVPRN